MRLHDLRHVAATLMLSGGVDVRTVMEVMGHSQVSLTLNTYAQVPPHTLDEAAQRVDALLAPPAAISGQDGGQPPMAAEELTPELRELSKDLVVSQNFASWNQLDGWLRQLEGLRRTA
jgi:Phage integrase family